MNHRDLCHLATTWLMKKPNIDIAGWEISRSSGIIDAVACSNKHKAIYIVECKRTRADLLQDLNKQKMLKYEKATSYCYLLATPEALMSDKFSESEIIADLTAKGLPKQWGILLASNQCVRVIRRATSYGPVKDISLRLLIKQIGRAHMYRHMNLLNIVV